MKSKNVILSQLLVVSMYTMARMFLQNVGRFMFLHNIHRSSLNAQTFPIGLLYYRIYNTIQNQRSIFKQYNTNRFFNTIYLHTHNTFLSDFVLRVFIDGVS